MATPGGQIQYVHCVAHFRFTEVPAACQACRRRACGRKLPNRPSRPSGAAATACQARCFGERKPISCAFHGLCAARGGRRASLEDLGDAVQGSDLADAWQARHFVQGAGRGTPAPFSHELQAQRLQAHAPLDAFGLCQGNGKFCEASGRRQVRAHLTWHQIQAV